MHGSAARVKSYFIDYKASVMHPGLFVKIIYSPGPNGGPDSEQ